MTSGIAGILQSKKFTAALMGILGAVGMALSGQITWKEASAAALTAIIAAILGQGAADVGKEAAKERAKAEVKASSESDLAAALEDDGGRCLLSEADSGWRRVCLHHPRDRREARHQEEDREDREAALSRRG